MWNIFINFPQFCHFSCHLILQRSWVLWYLHSHFIQFMIERDPKLSRRREKGKVAATQQKQKRSDGNGGGNEFWWFSEMAKMCFHNRIFFLSLSPSSFRRFFIIIWIYVHNFQMKKKFTPATDSLRLTCHASKYSFLVCL